jgi:hypothetical protein
MNRGLLSAVRIDGTGSLALYSLLLDVGQPWRVADLKT